MKTSFLFLSLAIPSLLVLADECTQDDLVEISNIYSKAMADGSASCPDLTAAADATDYCKYTKCLGYMSDILGDLPDCTSGGVNIKEGVQAAIDLCESGTADTSGVFTSTASSSATASDSTTSKGSTTATSSSSNSLLRTSSPSTDTTNTPNSDKITAITLPPAAGSPSGSSSASSFGLTIASAAFTLIFAAAL